MDGRLRRVERAMEAQAPPAAVSVAERRAAWLAQATVEEKLHCYAVLCRRLVGDQDWIPAEVERRRQEAQ